MSVAYIGQPGSFSELAAREYFGKKRKCVSKPEFKDVYKAVVVGETDYAIIPIENSLAGSIHQNYDLLLKGDLCIVGEVYLKVALYLLANKGVKRSDLRKVYSHPQPLAQSSGYLSKLKKIIQHPMATTSGSVKMIKDSGAKDSAAVASLQAAIDFDMEILASNIEDNHNNQTRFIVLAKNKLKIAPKTKKEIKTSIVFTLKNIPGALFKALSVFALRDIDLFKIESRPVAGKHFESSFYLDFSGNADSEAQKNALNHLREITKSERVLGSYVVGKVAEPNFKKRK